MGETDRLVILTGGPGSGKTTLLEALSRRGIAVSPESGRAVIRAEVASGGRALPWLDPALFARRMLDADMAARSHALAGTEPVVFDRGIPDVAGYLDLCGLPLPPRLTEAAQNLRYRRIVFVAPPWPEIFAQDSERKQDFAEACRTCEAMLRRYRSLGYEPVELPRASVEQRIAFVLAALPDLFGDLSHSLGS